MVFLLSSCIAGVEAYEQKEPLQRVSDLVWKKRVILIFENDHIKDSQTRLDKAETELVDRDTIWFMTDHKKGMTNYSAELSEDFYATIYEQYFDDVLHQEGAVLLIGKDGGVKYTSERLDLQEVFRTIDAMPMRQHEMQNR